MNRVPYLGLCVWAYVVGRALLCLLLGLLLYLFLILTFGLVFWACAPIVLNPISCAPPPPPPPQPLAKAGVGKGCSVSWIGCDFHVATRGWFDWGHVVVKRLVIMTTFRFSRPIRLSLLLPLGTSSSSYFIFLCFLVLFLCGFGFSPFRNIFVRCSESLLSSCPPEDHFLCFLP